MTQQGASVQKTLLYPEKLREYTYAHKHAATRAIGLTTTNNSNETNNDTTTPPITLNHEKDLPHNRHTTAAFS